ncbi:MAG: hypothetical protein AAGF93_21520 [Cyanobacteria bacterium P01_H01_bin.105]
MQLTPSHWAALSNTVAGLIGDFLKVDLIPYKAWDDDKATGSCWSFTELFY